ncbi:hypothetical protein C0991_004960 [Blastosporella zonata]|nr:hypothetical protein C0991_004960 [Blastosporella zonata]
MPVSFSSSSAFAADDTENRYLGNLYGIVMGTSHQEPMIHSTLNKWDLYGNGTWDYTVNVDNIKSEHNITGGAGIYYHIC